MDFEGIVDQHYAPLYRFALSLTRSESDACDLIQQTFYIWAAKGHQLQDSAKVKTWLFTTLYREFLGRRRRETRFPIETLEAAGEELPVLEPEWIDQLDGRAVVKLLGEVDSPFRAPVALFYLEDCPYKEIASILEIPVGTVKSRIARGLGQLRALLMREAGDDRLQGGAR